jgi:UrcA family protein
MLKTTAVGVVAAFGLAASVQAQPDYDSSYDYATGDLVVHAPRHQERSWSGAPIVVARTSRVVEISDLDLSTRWGVRELRNRVERAAYDACDELNNTPGLVPADDYDNVDCVHRAVDDAMAQAPITYVDYEY